MQNITVHVVRRSTGVMTVTVRGWREALFTVYAYRSMADTSEVLLERA